MRGNIAQLMQQAQGPGQDFHAFEDPDAVGLEPVYDLQQPAIDHLIDTGDAQSQPHLMDQGPFMIIVEQILGCK